jgi:hypothetical protein
MRLYLITTSRGNLDCINCLYLNRVTEKVPSGLPKEYVEAYEPRAGFVHPYDGYDTLGPLSEIASIVTQHVTRSQGCNITERVNSNSR